MTPNALLKAVPLFSGLNDSEIEPLAERSRRRAYAAKQQIIWRGEPGETLFVIVSGQVKVHSATEAGGEVTMAILGPQTCFGELSVLDESPRNADVTAISKTDCLLLDGSALKEAIRKNSEIGLRLLQHLAQTIREQNANIEALASKDVTGRVALLLLRLAEQHGAPWADADGRKSPRVGVRISVPLTKIDLAALVGATREHVTNIMSDFTRAGSISSDSVTGHIVVLNRDQLGRRVQ